MTFEPNITLHMNELIAHVRKLWIQFLEDSHLSLVHFMVGVGSPTELQGNRTSFIHGVVTVPPNDRILAGAVRIWTKNIKLIRLQGQKNVIKEPIELLNEHSNIT